jgi:hypothetical protein
MIDLFRMVHLSLYQADDQYILKMGLGQDAQELYASFGFWIDL